LESDHLRSAGQDLRPYGAPDVEDMPDAEESDHPTSPKSRASLTLCMEQTIAFALQRRFASHQLFNWMSARARRGRTSGRFRPRGPVLLEPCDGGFGCSARPPGALRGPRV